MRIPASLKFDPQAPGVRGRIGTALEFLTITALLAWELAKYAGDRFARLSPRVRGVFLISVAIVLLAFASTLIARSLQQESEPGIREWLGTVPYALETRALPSVVESTGDGASVALPASFGDFERISGEPADPDVSSLLNLCLLDTTVGPDNRCNVQQPRVNLAFERYRSGETWVEIGVAQIDSAAHASETLAGLYRYARRTGQTGNFAIYGVGAVDYFYSREPGWISFAYRQDTWIIAVSARTQAALDAAVEQFPY